MGYRSNPILLRLGSTAKWSATSFAKYDYSLRHLTHLQTYNYLTQLFRPAFFVSRVIFFSHISVLHFSSRHVINIHIFDKRIQSTKYIKFFWRISRGKLDTLRKSRNLPFWRPWKRRIKFSNKIFVKRKRLAQIFFIFSKYILPYLKYSHPFSKLLRGVVSRSGVLSILILLTKFKFRVLIKYRGYRRLIFSFRTYIINLVKFIKIISALLSTKSLSLEYNRNSKRSRLEHLHSILQSKIPVSSNSNFKEYRIYTTNVFNKGSSYKNRIITSKGSQSPLISHYIYRIFPTYNKNVRVLRKSLINKLSCRQQKVLLRAKNNFKRIIVRYLRFNTRTKPRKLKKTRLKFYSRIKSKRLKLRVKRLLKKYIRLQLRRRKKRRKIRLKLRRSSLRRKKLRMPFRRYGRKTRFKRLLRRIRKWRNLHFKRKVLVKYKYLYTFSKRKLKNKKFLQKSKKFHKYTRFIPSKKLIKNSVFTRRLRTSKYNRFFGNNFRYNKAFRYNRLHKYNKFRSKKFTRNKFNNFRRFRRKLPTFKRPKILFFKLRRRRKSLRKKKLKRLRRLRSRHNSILIKYLTSYRIRDSYLTTNQAITSFNKILKRRTNPIKLLSWHNTNILNLLARFHERRTRSILCRKYKKMLSKKFRSVNKSKLKHYIVRNKLSGRLIKCKKIIKFSKFNKRQNKRFIRLDKITRLLSVRFKTFLKHKITFNKKPFKIIRNSLFKKSLSTNYFKRNKKLPLNVTFTEQVVSYKQSLICDLLRYFNYFIFRHAGTLKILIYRKILPIFRFNLFAKVLFIFLRKIWYYQLSLIIRSDFSKILGNKLVINFIKVKKGCYHPDLITRFIIFRLLYQYRFGEIVYPLLKELSRQRFHNKISGAMIICSGRLTRKQRASRKSLVLRKIGLSTLSSRILYSFNTVQLRYGISGIKFYVGYKN